MLNEDAANLYYSLSSHVFSSMRAMSFEHYEARLRFLIDNTDPELRYANLLGEREDEEEDEEAPEWPLGERPAVLEDRRASEIRVIGAGRFPMVQFMPGADTGLTTWEFHIGDMDPYPSIPHGHEGKKKLDAYQGWVWRGDNRESREERWKIIALWNDNKFRDFAIRSIKNYRYVYQDWDGWPAGIAPLRLPRKRKR